MCLRTPLNQDKYYYYSSLKESTAIIKTVPTSPVPQYTPPPPHLLLGNSPLSAENVQPQCAEEKEEHRHDDVELGQGDLPSRQEAVGVLLLDVDLKASQMLVIQ